MEASIEHLSRGTVRHVETLLIVTEPYFRALETFKRTVPLARELGIANIYVVANKVRSERAAAMISEYATRLGVEVIAAIPWDDAVQEADRQGKALIDHMPVSLAAAAIARIVDALSTGTAAPRSAVAM